MEFKHILFETKDSVGYIIINHPEIRNPIGNDTKFELIQAFDRCEFDDNIRAVVLRGAGGTFSAGGDLRAMKKRIDAGEYGTQISCRLGAQMNLRLRNLKKPTIAWVEGAAAGAGICLALACDFQVVADNTKMKFAFVNIGYVPDSGATYFVTRTLGTARTTDLFMSGRQFTGRQAADWGLVTEAVPPDQLESRVSQYIKKYAKGPTAVYGRIKTMINQAQYSQYSLGMLSEIELQGQCERGSDFKEAVNAFFEKRSPYFTGK